MGGTPVPIDWSEAYTGLQRGTVKGLMTGYDSISSAKIQEVAPYLLDIRLSTAIINMVVNKEKWEALPLDVQVIAMEELSKSMVATQAYVPLSIDNEINHQLETGLKKVYPKPEGWDEMYGKMVVKPMIKAELEQTGALGLEVVEAIEKALGRSMRD